MQIIANTIIFAFICNMRDQDIIIRSKRATQAIFLVCGFAISSWAPMVPLAKERLGLNDANLGYLLLMLGAGAIIMMPISGYLSQKYGTRIIILVSGLVAAISLPCLLIMPSPILMGVALFIFGSGVGTIDVAMNSHGIKVQNEYGKQIMSSLHGLFSVGGLCGSLGLGILIKFGLNPLAAAISIAVLLIVILIYNYGHLLSRSIEKSFTEVDAYGHDQVKRKPSKVLNPSVIFLGLGCFVVFLSEGAILDWSALFLKENRNIDTEFSGLGYASFSIAMATMRLLGDNIVEKLGGKRVVIFGGMIAAAGIFLAVGTPWLATSLAGFILLGIGAANIVPVFFSEGGKIKGIDSAVAITVISTMGYAGQLAGPALLGFIAFHYSLSVALNLLGILLLIVAISYLFRKENTI
jgi:predicted MFS family arabinose efflux permease